MQMDNQKNIDELNSEIAELLGAFIGDGWIQKNGNSLFITGSPIEDKDYYDNFIAPLFSKHFSEVKPKLFPYWKVYGIGLYRQNIIKKAINCGFQIGHKCLVAKIPNNVFNSSDNKIIIAVIRGIFDTDGSFWCEKSNAKTSTEWKRTHNHHPELRITSCSEELLKQIQYLLHNLGIESQLRQKNIKRFKNNRNNNNSYSLNVRKISEIEKWFNIIGTNNPRHKTRYQIWKKLGYLPPKTTIIERQIILNN